MKPNEIRAELIRNNIKVKDIAAGCSVASQQVSMAISNKRPYVRIRQAIADALTEATDKPVLISDLWPEQEQS